MLHPVRSRMPLILVLVLTTALGPGCAAETTAASMDRGQDTATAHGAVVTGSSNPMRFRPKESAAPVANVDSLNLRSVFEMIGEEATLWYQHVQTLANPFFEGRADGSEGIERARDYIRKGFGVLQAWMDARRGTFSLIPPQASAIAFVRYHLDINSTLFAERLCKEKSVLVVPGDHFGMDRFLRISFGLPRDYLTAGLDRIHELIRELQA